MKKIFFFLIASLSSISSIAQNANSNKYSFKLVLQPISLQAGVHFNYQLHNDAVLTFGASYMNFGVRAIDTEQQFIYKAPAFLIGISKLKYKSDTHTFSYGVYYEYRHKIFSKYCWADGVAGYGMVHREERSDIVYSNNLLVLIFNEYKVGTHFNIGYFMGAGVQAGKAKVHRYSYGNDGKCNEGDYPANTFKNEFRYSPLSIRVGVFVGYKK